MAGEEKRGPKLKVKGRRKMADIPTCPTIEGLVIVEESPA